MTNATFSVAMRARVAGGAIVAALAFSAAAAPLTGVVAIEAGYGHQCAVTAGGGLTCWGANGFGMLGDGTTTSRPLPVDVVGWTSGTAAVSANQSHTCAVTAAGGAQCWGQNWYGQLGNGGTTAAYSDIVTPPVDVQGLTSGVIAVTGGWAHSCALTNGGGVKCWGGNDYGQLGDGSPGNHRPTPGDVAGLTNGVIAIAAGTWHTCALTSVGGVKCWGANANGQLGSGSVSSHQATAVDVSGLASGVVAIAAGSSHTCAITSGGGAKCWGNHFGGLGDGTQNPSAFPVDVSGLASGVAGISAGGGHTCAVTTGGGVKCWGANQTGVLGDGSTIDRHAPVDVLGLGSGVTAVAAGEGHTCAITSGGLVKCWGANFDGNLGNGGISARPQPYPSTVGALLAQEITFPAVGNRAIGSSPSAFAATASSGLPVEYVSLAPAVCTMSGATMTLVAEGVCTVAAYQLGDAQYNAAPLVRRSFVVWDAIAAAAPRLGNLSTRGNVLGGQDLLIAGFVIGGATPKTVVVRARGPSLSAFGVLDPLADPQFQLFSGQTPIRHNDSWTSTADSVTIEALGLAPSSVLESAIQVTLQPGAYTAMVSGVFSVGTSIVEVFEVDMPQAPLVNISTRGYVYTGDNAMIGGFVIVGDTPQTVVIRARGPSLAAHGVVGPLANPRLQLVRSSDQASLETNDDWGAASNAADITASGYAPADPLESAILTTLPPGAYTAIVTGAGGATGVAIVEVFAVSTP